MGNALALKIHHIHDTNLLKDVSVADGRRILPFVYYVTKINKLYVENILNGAVVKEFSVFNILTKKEHHVGIDRVESGLFFSGLIYKLEELPSLPTLLLVTKILENSLVNDKGLIANSTLILGSESKYFTCFEDVDKAILEGEMKFVFYDFCEEKILTIDFARTRGVNNKDEGLKLGFECELRTSLEIMEIIKTPTRNKKPDEKTQHENFPNEFEYIKIKETNFVTTSDKLEGDRNEPAENAMNLQNEEKVKPELNINLNKEVKFQVEPNTEFVFNKSSNNDVSLDGPSPQASLVTPKLNTQIEEKINLHSENKFATSLIEKEIIDKNIHLKEDSILNNIENPRSSVTDFDEMHSEKAENEEAENSSTRYEEKSNYDKVENNISLSPLVTKSPLQRWKYKFGQAKPKYKKKLSIYEQTDANYNFMTLRKEPSISTRLNKTNQGGVSEEGIKSSGEVLLNKKKVLIKGFSLPCFSDLKISQLEENTINVLINE